MRTRFTAFGQADSLIAISREYRVSVATVRDARVGKTWTDHATPPDSAPRSRLRHSGGEAAGSGIGADDHGLSLHRRLAPRGCRS
jgi:hypothetical protein